MYKTKLLPCICAVNSWFDYVLLTLPMSALERVMKYNWLRSVLATRVSSDGLTVRLVIICCWDLAGSALFESCGI